MKSLTKFSTAKWLLLVSLVLFIFISCQKETTVLKQQEDNAPVAGVNNNANTKKIKAINVINISQLYDAVNDPANAGSLLVLAPGTYILNASYPNAGRLELQFNMQLQGQPGNSDKVVIDASALPGTSFVPPNNFPAARTGAIRMGRGYNIIEWLTVKGNATAQALSAIETDLIWQGVSRVRIAHVKVTGARIGIDIRNAGIASAGRILEANLEENELVENLVQQGQGLEIQNANGASGATISADLHGNYIHGNKIGLRSFTNNANGANTNNGVITIQSHGDRFEENGIGVYLNAALSQAAPTTGANNNSLSFEAHGTKIVNNRGTLPPPPEQTPACGMYAVGGLSIPGGSTSNNKLSVKLGGCRFSDNNGADIIAFGAFSYSAIPAGTHNTTEIYLQGVSKKALVMATPSSPTEPAGTNIVNIIR